MQTALYILGQLNDDDVEWLLREGMRHKYEIGEDLIVQGKANDYLFIVLDGHASIEIAGRGEVNVVGWGEILGEMSMVEARPPSATVTAREACYVLRLPYARLNAHVRRDQAFGMRFYRALATMLSARLRRQGLPGYDTETGILEGTLQKDELDPNVLDSLHVAGARFERIRRRMMHARSDEDPVG